MRDQAKLVEETIGESLSRNGSRDLLILRKGFCRSVKGNAMSNILIQTPSLNMHK